MDQATITVLLADDHDLFRAGICLILDAEEDVQVVAEASSGEEVLQLVQGGVPDVILMDLGMPGMGGMEATHKLLRTHEGLKVIALTARLDEPYPTQFLEAGGMGYLSKSCPASEVVGAIRSVARGVRYLSGDVARSVALSPKDSPLSKLSARELAVMRLVTRGLTIREIGDTLNLSPKTVSTYRYRLFDKLAVKNDVELTHLAMRHGLLDD